jgi:hypothetical protein
VELLFTVAPALRSVAEPREAVAVLDRHSRLGRVERRRHDALLHLVHGWAEARCGGTQVLRDVPVALLGGLADTNNVEKRSRRVDLSFVRGGRLKLVEVTVVRDSALSSRITEKLNKYSDLAASLSGSPWALERSLDVDDVAVIAVGVLGTVPECTRSALRDIGVKADEIDELVREMQRCVLRFNLMPFIEVRTPARRGSYMRQRRLQLQRQRRPKNRGSHKPTSNGVSRSI